MFVGVRSIEVGREADGELRRGVVCGMEPLDASRTKAAFSFEGKSLTGREESFCVKAGDDCEGPLEWLWNVAFCRLSDSLRSLPILPAFGGSF